MGDQGSAVTRSAGPVAWKRWSALAFGVIVCLAGAEPSLAQPKWSGPTEGETLRLPPYCQAKFRGPASPDYARWSQSIPEFGSVHHLCLGLNFFNRAQTSRTPRDRNTNLKYATDEFGYMITHQRPGFVLIADAYLHRGIAYALMKRDIEAANDLHQAVALNPRLERAYWTLADLYADRKQRDEALKVASEGLRYIPASEGLQKRYRELGGKLPYPDPVVVKTPEVAATPEVKPVEPAAAFPADSKPPAEPVATEAPAPAATPSAGRKRSCRFCADEALPAAAAPAATAEDPAPAAKSRSCRFCAE
jgi:tetratricopeptide (TPR) repeat protein